MKPEEKAELEALRMELNQLKSSTTIPQDVDGAFRERFKIDSRALLEVGTKAVSTETQSVDEDGSATYNVPKIMDGLVESELVGVGTIYLPYYLV